MKTDERPNWLSQNWNYIAGVITLFAMTYYGPKLNEIVSISIFAPTFVYFMVLHPLVMADE
mgnify:CR=1 FL=1